MSFTPFDVVVVPFPYTDRMAEKRRPALVVSAPVVENRLHRLWVVMITSVVDSKAFGDVLIGDLETAGLPAPSLVRVSKLATIEADRVVKRAGALSADDRRQVIAALKGCAAF